MEISKDFDVAVVNVLPDNIIRVLIKRGKEVKLEHAQNMLDWLKSNELSNLKTLILPELGASIDHEIRDHMTSKSRIETVIADAIVITNFAHQLVANFYMRYHKPQIPTKIFRTEQKALEWLKALRLSN